MIAAGEPFVKPERSACNMAEQNTLEAGNASIRLVGTHDPFSDGHTTGYLEFYDERHRPPFPLTSQIVCDHLMAIVQDQVAPSLWKAGRITGWIEALLENSPHTLRSYVAAERMTVLQKV